MLHHARAAAGEPAVPRTTRRRTHERRRWHAAALRRSGRPVDEAQLRGVGSPEYEPVAEEVDRRARLPLEAADPDQPTGNAAAKAHLLAPKDLDVLEGDERVRHLRLPLLRPPAGKLDGSPSRHGRPAHHRARAAILTPATTTKAIARR